MSTPSEPRDDVRNVTVQRRAARRLRGGHRWVYRSDVTDTGGAAPGDVVRVVDPGGTALGRAFYSSASQIALRFLSLADEPIGPAFLGRRLGAAIALRERLYPAQVGGASAVRLVHAEADGLPGLVVDRYADVLVLQTTIQGTDRRRDFWADWLESRLGPRAIVERNDLRVRRYEDLPERVGLLRGSLAGPVAIDEGPVRLVVDPLGGQKTGAFLDQRENHRAAAALVRPDDRCADVFSYAGGFALQMARAGGRVTAVDSSNKALAELVEAARHNQLEVEAVCENAFDWLNAQVAAEARYDVITLDPPAFARSKKALAGARRGYKEINLRAVQLLNTGGWLVTCSCSHNLSETQLIDLVRDAAADARRAVQLVEKRGAGRDHPALIGVPETDYLKCLVLRVVDA